MKNFIITEKTDFFLLNGTQDVYGEDSCVDTGQHACC